MNFIDLLPPDLLGFPDSYAKLFGTVPPLPVANFDFSGDINPDSLRLAELQRAHAFYSDVFDTKHNAIALIWNALSAWCWRRSFPCYRSKTEQRQLGITI